jgi:hypothetical protein
VIPISSGVRVWIATDHTDMRHGMNFCAHVLRPCVRPTVAIRPALTQFYEALDAGQKVHFAGMRRCFVSRNVAD